MQEHTKTTPHNNKKIPKTESGNNTETRTLAFGSKTLYLATKCKRLRIKNKEGGVARKSSSKPFKFFMKGKPILKQNCREESAETPCWGLLANLFAYI